MFGVMEPLAVQTVGQTELAQPPGHLLGFVVKVDAAQKTHSRSPSHHALAGPGRLVSGGRVATTRYSRRTWPLAAR